MVKYNIIDLSRPVNCLEIGCAEGRVLHCLQEKGFKVTGCEVNKEVSSIGGDKFNINIINEAIENIQIQNNTFDTIFSFHTFEHLINPTESLQKCYYLLKSGGKLLLEIPLEDYAPDHLQFYTMKSITILMHNIFGNVNCFDNSYTNGRGQKLGSLYITAVKQL